MKKLLYVALSILATLAICFVLNIGGDLAYADNGVVASKSYTEKITDATEDEMVSINLNDITSEGSDTPEEIYLVDNLTSKTKISADSSYTIEYESESYVIPYNKTYNPNTVISHTTGTPFVEILLDEEVELEPELVVYIISEPTSPTTKNFHMVFGVDQYYEGTITFYIATKFSEVDIQYTTLEYTIDRAESISDVTASFTQSSLTGAPTLSLDPTDNVYYIEMKRQDIKDYITEYGYAGYKSFLASYVSLNLGAYAGENMFCEDIEGTPTPIATADRVPNVNSSLSYELQMFYVDFSYGISYITRDSDGFVKNPLDEYVTQGIQPSSMYMKVKVLNDYEELNVNLTDSQGNILTNTNLGDVAYGNNIIVYYTITDEFGNRLASNETNSNRNITSSTGGINNDSSGYDSTNRVYSYTITLNPNTNNAPHTFTISATSTTYQGGDAPSGSVSFTARYVRPNPTASIEYETGASFNKNVTKSQIQSFINNLKNYVIYSDADNYHYASQTSYYIAVGNEQTDCDTWVDGFVSSVGSYIFKVVSKDAYNLEATATYTFSIIRNAPTVDTTLTFTKNDYNYGEQAVASFTASDLDDDTLTFHVESKINNSVDISIESSGGNCTVTVVNKPRYSGEVRLEYWVSDVDQESEHCFTTYNVLDYIDVTSPTLVLTKSQDQIAKNTDVNLIDYVDQASDDNPMIDIDARNVTYRFSANIDEEDAVIENGVLKIFKSGDFTVIYLLSDGTHTTERTVVFTATNTSPVTQNASVTLSYTRPLQIQAVVTDADGDEMGIDLMTRTIYDSENNVINGSLSVDNTSRIITLILSDSNKKFIGTVHFSYRAFDNENAYSSTSTAYITIIDDIAPVISREQSLPTTFTIGRVDSIDLSSYVSGTDYIDGDITPTITGTVDTTETGEYTVSYSFKDRSNNESTTSIEFTILANARPVIELISEDYHILQGEAFNILDFIYCISDTEDGEITEGFDTLERLATSCETDMTQPGVHIISLIYEDSDGYMSDVVQFTLYIDRPLNVWIIVIPSIAGVGLIVGGVFLIRFIHFKRISKI